MTLMISKEENVVPTISMGTEVGQSELSSVANAPIVPEQASLISEAPVQAPKKKRGRPRKNQDLHNLTTKLELPSVGAPFPLSSRTPQEYSAYESAPAACGSPTSDTELPQVQSDTPNSAVPAVYPSPYSKNSPVKDQHTDSPVVKRGRGRPPKNQALGKNSLDSNVSGKKQQDDKIPNGILTPSSCDREKDPKRPRGRPKGSGKTKTEMPQASESPAENVRDAAAIAPQVLQINPGEDVAKVVTSFCQKVLRPMCVLSASGAVEHVELKHQFPSSDGSTIYEGMREILCMSGYFVAAEVANERSWSTRLSVALADSGGAVIGGGVSGSMIAATKVHVVLGSLTCAETATPQESLQPVKQA